MDKNVLFESFGQINTNSIADQSKLIKYLDDFGKQISIRKSNNTGLEEQLATLSKAYNQAQQKLLATQKALMAQTLLLEKQRSVLEIYKYILGQSMEDETIITFIQHLQQDTEEKNQIWEELNEIKSIMSRKRVKGMKKVNDDDRSVRQLRKQMSRLHEEKRLQQESSQILNNQNYELKQKILQFQTIIKQMKAHIADLMNKIQQKESGIILKNKIIQQKQALVQSQTTKLSQLHLKIKDQSQKQENYFKMERQILAINSLLQEKLNISFQNNYKQNLNSNFQRQNLKNNHYASGKIPEKFKKIQEKINKLLKYRLMYKKQKENDKSNEFLIREVSILKLFLSEEGLKLVKELEEQKLQCLQDELRNLAALQKARSYKLQQCEKEIWRYKMRILRDQQEQMSTTVSYMKSSNQLFSKNKSYSSKDVSVMLQSVKQEKKQEIHQISDFNQS